jgi:soluble lytic murein transglycosylase-like protein
MAPDLFIDLRSFHEACERSELRAVVVWFAVLASMALALVGASIGRVGSMAANAPLLRSAAAPSPLKSPAIALRATGPKQLPIEENIDALARVVGAKYRVSHDMTREFLATAYREAKLNRLDPMLVVAVMAVESGFNPAAQSDAGAIGLMQVIPRYHPEKFSAERGESVRDPSINIRVGSQALRQYIARGGTEAAGLQLYNGAPDTGYVAKVTAERQRLQDAMRRLRERA